MIVPLLRLKRRGLPKPFRYPAPRPLDLAVEFCCPHKCFPRYDVRSWSECLHLPVWLRERRQAELRSHPGLFRGRHGGFGGAAVVVSPPVISEPTMWAWRAGGSVYDPASVAPPEE